MPVRLNMNERTKWTCYNNGYTLNSVDTSIGNYIEWIVSSLLSFALSSVFFLPHTHLVRSPYFFLPSFLLHSANAILLRFWHICHATHSYLLFHSILFHRPLSIIAHLWIFRLHTAYKYEKSGMSHLGFAQYMEHLDSCVKMHQLGLPHCNLGYWLK